MARISDGGGEESKYALGFSGALGRTIKVIRTDLGVERRELAAKAGISYSYLTEIENGNKPPSSSVLAPIASALGLRMSQLIDAAEARMERQNVAAWSEGASAAGMPADQLAPARRTQRMAAQAGQAAGPQATIPQGAAVPRMPDQIGDARVSARARNAAPRIYPMEPAERASHRDARAAAIELERLLREMTPEDVERVLEYARWVAR